MEFDPQAFERLSGLDASNYALGLVEHGISNSDAMIGYFIGALPTMDSPHLEVAIYLLAKCDTKQAWSLVGDYISHSDFRVRFVAIKMIKEAALVDDILMAKIIDALSTNNQDSLTKELLSSLDRPENDNARDIAQAFREKNNRKA